MQFFKEEGYRPSRKIFFLDLKQIAALLLSAGLSCAFLITAKEYNGRTLHVLFKILTALNLSLMIGRLLNYLCLQKNFDPSTGLPLHLCSFNVILCFAAAWTYKPLFLDFIFAMAPLPALVALIFPEAQAAKYPKINFRSIEYYFSHTCLIVASFIPLFMGFAPNMQFAPASAAMFLCMLITARAANKKYASNYMYFHHAPLGTPLAAVEKAIGNAGYLAVLLLFFVVLYIAMHFLYRAVSG